MAAGTPVRYYNDLADPDAKAGRMVRLGATVYATAKPLNIQASNAQGVLGRFFSGFPAKGPDAQVIRESTAGWVLETSADGELAEDWTVGALLRSVQEATLERVKGDGLAVAGVEPAALDLGGAYGERIIAPDSSWYTDSSGESNPDGTVAWGTVIGEGAEEGLEDLGEAAGGAVNAVGKAAGNLAGAAGAGFFKGLGAIGTLILVLVVIVVLFFAFGGLHAG